MGLVLLWAIVATKLPLFYLGRHYGKPIKFGWLGASSFAAVTSMGLGFITVPHLFFYRSDGDTWRDPRVWGFLVPLFILSFSSMLILDRPNSRFLYFAVGWHLLMIAYFSFVIVCWLRSVL